MGEKVILLVEDEPDDVVLTVGELSKSRIANKVVVAKDGQEAVDYLLGTGSHAGRDIRELPALVLLDLHLPKLDGIEVLQRIRADERTHLLPVVVLTTSSEDRDLLKSYEAGANGFVQKPVDFAQFSEAVRQLSLYWLLLNEGPPQRQANK